VIWEIALKREKEKLVMAKRRDGSAIFQTCKLRIIREALQPLMKEARVQ
jgi:hypothetical protein